MTIDSDSQITAVSPAHTAGTVDLIVLSPGGNSTAVDFTYNPLPVLLGLVGLAGTGFTGLLAGGLGVLLLLLGILVVTIRRRRTLHLLS